MRTESDWASVSTVRSSVIVEGRCAGSMLGMLLELAMVHRDRGRLEIATPDSTFRFRFRDRMVLSASEDPPQPSRRLGDLLVDGGHLPLDAVERALEVQREAGGRLGDLLVGQHAIRESELAAILRSQALLRIDAALQGDQVDYRVLEDSGIDDDGDQPLGVRVEQLLGRGASR